jgi:arylsulfatase A-like enzyme
MAKSEKPNILIIWGDDIGWFNVSAYNLGLMGYRTPNIDRVAREGALFTDWYGQQSFESLPRRVQTVGPGVPGFSAHHNEPG